MDQGWKGEIVSEKGKEHDEEGGGEEEIREKGIDRVGDKEVEKGKREEKDGTEQYRPMVERRDYVKKGEGVRRRRQRQRGSQREGNGLGGRQGSRKREARGEGRHRVGGRRS
ncbi:uncharacterized protein DS421_13g437900 [Arachis hypogaea]|nr:uncharacterized protein DS421_13g437900 [Arachis hypogaea]